MVDKNGKMVIVGDILRIPVKVKRNMFVVRWVKDILCLCQVKKKKGYNPHYGNIIGLVKKGKVIGNLRTDRKLLRIERAK